MRILRVMPLGSSNLPGLIDYDVDPDLKQLTCNRNPKMTSKSKEPKSYSKSVRSLMQLCGLLDRYVDTQDWSKQDRESIALAWSLLDRKGVTPEQVSKSIDYQKSDSHFDQDQEGSHRELWRPHPGPCFVEGTEVRCNPDAINAGQVICELISSRSPHETAANARLIEIAPQMRTILEDLVDSHESLDARGIAVVSLELIEKAQDLLARFARSCD